MGRVYFDVKPFHDFQFEARVLRKPAKLSLWWPSSSRCLTERAISMVCKVLVCRVGKPWAKGLRPWLEVNLGLSFFLRPYNMLALNYPQATLRRVLTKALV